MENVDTSQTELSGASGTLTPNAAVPAKDYEDKPDINPLSKDLNLKFPVPQFYDEDLELWFWQLESTFIVNKVTQSKDKYSYMVNNLPYKIIHHNSMPLAV